MTVAYRLAVKPPGGVRTWTVMEGAVWISRGGEAAWGRPHVDGHRRLLPDGAAGRGVAGGAPASVVAEHGPRLCHLAGAVVDVPGAARRGGSVAGDRRPGGHGFLVVAAERAHRRGCAG